MRIAGLTGGIASGKSTCSELLRQHGIVIVDCDEIAHAVTKKGRWGWKRLVSAFGQEILDPSGEIDRAKLGCLVFSNKSLRRKLNAATHLPVGVELIRQLAWHWLCCRRLVVIDMPLLFETGMYKYVRPRILVYTQPGTQVRRMISRDKMSTEDAVNRLHAQLPLEDKLPLADIVISNDGSLQQLEDEVAQLAKALKAKAGLRDWFVSPIAAAAGLFAFSFLLLK